MNHKVDVLVVGAGPAGVSAALYAKARGKEVLVLEAKRVGGLIGTVSLVSHYAALLGGETGPEFAQRLEAQLQAAQIPLRYERVTQFDLIGETKVLTTDQAVYEAKAVVLAMGSSPKALPIEADGVQVFHETLSQLDAVKDRVVFVAGGSDGAAKEALKLAQVAKKVILIQDQPQLMMIHEFRQQIEGSERFEIHCASQIVGVEQENGLISKVQVAHKNKGVSSFEEGPYFIFAFIGQKPNSEGLACLAQADGYLKSVDGVKTEIPGVFVAGDLREKSVRQVSTAVADGTLAGVLAAAYCA